MRREVLDHAHRKPNRRNESILWVMQIKPSIEHVVFGRRDRLHHFEEPEFELRMNVRKNLLPFLLPLVVKFPPTPILKRREFVKPVFGDEPTAKIGAAFVRLKSARHEQRELPTFPH